MTSLTLNSSLDETVRIAEIFAKSGYFSDVREMAQAVVKIMAGAELGFGPLASMQGVYIVKGKPSYSANVIAAAIQRSRRYHYSVKQLDNECCVLVFSSTDHPDTFESSFTIEDAKTAGLISENYRKFPRNMLFARALTNGARIFCPEVFNGIAVYTPEELGRGEDEQEAARDMPQTPRQLPQPVQDEPASRDAAMEDALTDWLDMSEQAEMRGIEHRRQPPPDVTLAELHKGVEVLRHKIEKHDATQALATRQEEVFAEDAPLPMGVA